MADLAAQAATVERSIRPQAIALGLFALVLAVTALLVVGQVGVAAAAGGVPGQRRPGGAGHDPRPADGRGPDRGRRGGRRRRGAGLRRGDRGLPADADRPARPGRARSGPEHRRPGAGRGLRRDRDLAAGPGGLARLAAGLGPARRRARRGRGAGPPLAGRRAAGPGRCTGLRRDRPAARLRPRPGRTAVPGARRPGRPGPVGGRGDCRRDLRREPAPPGAHAAAVRPELGRRGGPGFRCHHAAAVRPPDRARARPVRLDVRRARHRDDRRIP